jgi:hypothetical protein
MLKIVATLLLLSDFVSLSACCTVLFLHLTLEDEVEEQHLTAASNRYPIIS